MAGREELKRRAATCIDNHKEHLVSVGEEYLLTRNLAIRKEKPDN